MHAGTFTRVEETIVAKNATNVTTKKGTYKWCAKRARKTSNREVNKKMEAKHVDEKGEVELGYLKEDDYGVLLDERKSNIKKWIIDTACSSIFVREKFTKFKNCEKKSLISQMIKGWKSKVLVKYLLWKMMVPKWI